MSFSDPRYLIFLGLTAIALPLLRQGMPRLIFVVLVSLAFYVHLNPVHWWILVLVGAFAYLGGWTIERAGTGRARSAAFMLALFCSLLPLLMFKYAGSVRWIALPHDVNGGSFSLAILPIGISFYTFFAVGYLIDVFVGTTPVERSGIRFAAGICFFPNLTAGPIERSRHLLSQLPQLGEFDYARTVAGLRAIVVGLFMKVVIADTLAPHVDAVYAQPRSYGATDLAMATIYFSFQVYADFAGYSLIAIGSARLLGIELLSNFQQPYLSGNVAQYWRTWHISLSSWFKDYVFIPLHFQVRRFGAYGLATTLIFTFLLVGIWHGASLKYALFGLIHGTLIAFSTLTFAKRDRFWRSIGVPKWWLSITRPLLTFAAVSLTFVLFRAEDVSDAIWIWQTLLSLAPKAATLPVSVPCLLIALLVIGDLLVAIGRPLSSWPQPLRWSAYYVCTAVVLALTVNNALHAAPPVQQFIYFKY